MNIYLDYETASDVPIEHGIYKYLKHPSAKVVCMAFAVDDGPVKLWAPGYPYPFESLKPFGGVSTVKWYAHNAWFDLRVWNWLCTRDWGWPINHIDNWIDAMALCGRYTFPQKLENVGAALDLPIQKNPRGKYLIKRICCPPYDYTEAEMKEFREYCKTDVATLRGVVKAMPADYLTKKEQQIWKLTQKINATGLPVDIKSARQILAVTEAYQIEHAQLLPDLTNQVITKPTQTVRIKKWINSEGHDIPNLQADTVTAWLEKELPEHIKSVLEIRKELGSTSIKKFKRIVEQEYNGKIYDNLKYYGANTGRWAGYGFQIHNLPRATVKDVEAAFKSFFDYSVLENNPIAVAKALVRGIIKAPPGYYIAALDYTSIENVLLAWVTQDETTLKKFRFGFCQYSDMAETLFNVPYKDILEGHKAGDKEMSELRRDGKVVILGSGYGLGAKGLKEKASSYGVELSIEQAQQYIDTYRKKYRLVPKLWYRCRDTAFTALDNFERAFTYKRNTFRYTKDKNNNRWLQLTLPSGRALYYNKPEIQEGKYGPEVTAMGINPYSKKWQRLKVIPGRFAENIIQALARDVLCNGKISCDKRGYKILGSIHDEIVFLLSKRDCRGDNALEPIIRLMCKVPTWASGLPLRAEGFIAKRFRKG